MTVKEVIKINEEKLKTTTESEEKEIYTNIQKILEKDEGIFFKINMNKALGILKYLFKKDELLDVYYSLINIQNFQELKKNFKL